MAMTARLVQAQTSPPQARSPNLQHAVTTALSMRSGPDNAALPRYLYRVTSGSSYVKIDGYGNFDTGCTPFYHLSYIIDARTLNHHLDWRYGFDITDPNDLPVFISMTDDLDWAKEEFRRRLAERHANVRLYRIRTAGYSEQHEMLGPGSPGINLFRQIGNGTAIFSTGAASAALPGWSYNLKDRREWFATHWIPASNIDLLA